MTIDIDTNQPVLDPKEVDLASRSNVRPVLPGVPRCPHCGDQPARVMHSPFALPAPVPITAIVFFCAACWKVWNVQIVNVGPPPGPGEKLIVVPN